MNDEHLFLLEQRIEQLEARLEQMQAQAASQPTTLVTPVSIVTPQGQLIASIEQRENDQSIRLFNAQGKQVAALGVDGTNAGYLAIRNAAGSLVGYLDVETYGARLQLSDHRDEGGVVVFGGDSGSSSGGGIHINHSFGGVSISLWSTPNGGEVTLYDTAEEAVVTLPAAVKE